MLIAMVVFQGLIVIMLVLLWKKGTGLDLSPFQIKLDSLEKWQEKIDRSMRDEMAKNRDEMSNASRQGREEAGNNLKGFGDSLQSRMAEITVLQKTQLDGFAGLLEALTNNIKGGLDKAGKAVEGRLDSIRDETARQLASVREDSTSSAKSLRVEVSTSLKGFGDSWTKNMGELSTLLKNQFSVLSEHLGKMVTNNDQRMEALKATVEERLKHIQNDNTKQLDLMRATVDEKLQGTLEKRLGESFKQVSERLEQVHKGLGEMQNLATGVGDLKRVLTNVKTRGNWGEVQLQALLEEILTTDQYGRNVRTKEGSRESVEFAIKLPGRGDNDKDVVWLPIDSKFPIEDYQRLIDAHETANLGAAEEASKLLAARIRGCAKDIQEKYINPPRTTDFGIMFLPTEGLYAEVARRTDLLDTVRREYGVIIAGPSTFAAVLNSLQMGFRTLAIQKRSNEVWTILGTVKTEFGKFTDILESVKKKLDQASNTMDDAAKKSRTIERKLKDVQGVQILNAKEQDNYLLPQSSDLEDGEIEDVPF